MALTTVHLIIFAFTHHWKRTKEQLNLLPTFSHTALYFSRSILYPVSFTDRNLLAQLYCSDNGQTYPQPIMDSSYPTVVRRILPALGFSTPLFFAIKKSIYIVTVTTELYLYFEGSSSCYEKCAYNDCAKRIYIFLSKIKSLPERDCNGQVFPIPYDDICFR